MKQLYITSVRDFEKNTMGTVEAREVPRLEDELIRLWQEVGSTVIFITHNIEEAVYLSERVLVLTNKPTKIKAEIHNDLPRPRDIADPRFIELRNQITELIKWW